MSSFCWAAEVALHREREVRERMGMRAAPSLPGIGRSMIGAGTGTMASYRLAMLVITAAKDGATVRLSAEGRWHH